jgi:hypothetical protein
MQNTCASLAFSSLEELQLSWATALLTKIFNASRNRHIILRWAFAMFKMVPVKPISLTIGIASLFSACILPNILCLMPKPIVLAKSPGIR